MFPCEKAMHPTLGVWAAGVGRRHRLHHQVAVAGRLGLGGAGVGDPAAVRPVARRVVAAGTEREADFELSLPAAYGRWQVGVYSWEPSDVNDE